MNHYPAISIIIPVYNVELYIARCVKSVVAQEYPGTIECIIVDDCGQDNSISIVEKLITEHNTNIVFQILHHEQNRGLSAARNTGVKAAAGDYVYYLDSDDYISKDCIATLVTSIAEHDYDIVIGNIEVLGNDWGVPKLIAEEGAYNDKILSMYCNRQFYMMAWNKLYKKSFIERNNLYFEEGILHEDDHMSFRAFAAADSVYVSHRKTYYYLVRESGIMSMNQYTKRNRDSYAETLLMIADYIQSHAVMNSEVHEWLNNRYLRLIATISDEQHISFLEIYRKLRKIYTYPLIKQVRVTNMQKRKIALRMHYLFGVYFGYLYFKIARKYLGYGQI